MIKCDTVSRNTSDLCANLGGKWQIIIGCSWVPYHIQPLFGTEKLLLITRSLQQQIEYKLIYVHKLPKKVMTYDTNCLSNVTEGLIWVENCKDLGVFSMPNHICPVWGTFESLLLSPYIIVIT